jgi:proline dehydrogenase
VSIINQAIVETVMVMPKSIVGIFSRKYIAGDTLEDAIRTVKQLNAKGIYATIDVLGESIQSREEAIKYKIEAIEVLKAIDEHKLMANLSIKPTQMGLNLDTEFAYDQIKEIVAKAREIESFVRIDMEDSSTTDNTFKVYRKIFQEYKNVGVVIQAYLKRSFDDVVELNKIGTNYRLCKGIYVEPATIAIKNRQAIRDNFMKILRQMLIDGNYVGIATHDKYLLDESYKLVKELEIPKNKFEFQMLLGVREDIRDKINKDGYKIRVYVPFGKDWYAYSIRRLKENPSIARHIVKSFLTFGKR